MAFFRNFLIAVALAGAPLGGLCAEVPTKLDEVATAEKSGSPADREKAIRELRDLLFPTGERVDNWNVGGADIMAALELLGADKHYLLQTEGSDGPLSVGIWTDRPIADFAPAAWRVVDSYGSNETVLENAGLAFAYLTPRYAFAVRGNSRPAGSAHCSDRVGHAILYEVPESQQSPEDKDIPDFFVGMIAAMDGFAACARYDGDLEKGYSITVFLPDGRRLLRPDRSISAGRATIVPAAPIDILIKPPPPAPATPQP
jgi:hypothetical protein